VEKLNQWLTLVANFGVVVGIVFLAYEMRLNTDSMKSNTAAQSMAAWNAITMDAATNPELIADQLEANQNGIGFDARGIKVHYFAGSMLKSTEYNFSEYTRGNLDQEHWDAFAYGQRWYIEGNPFMLQAWAVQRGTFTASFRVFVDELVRDICSEQACPEGGRPEDWTDLSN
jgi:hypothetical protein